MSMATTMERTATLVEDYRRHFSASERLYREALKLFPDGVTHDARFLKPFPPYVQEARGSHKWTVEGHELVDWWSGHGALLFGHGHPAVLAAVHTQLERGTHPGACHPLEVRWAELVQQLMPSMERLRFVSSGTEATMMALRLARMYTGRPRVLKFVGHFHGWNDFLIPAGEPPFEATVPGLLDGVRASTLLVPPNDLEAVEQALRRDPHIGCLILEPTGGHYGLIPADGQFLHGLRQVTERYGVLLIFDEVITGFRVHPGGAQGYYRIRPDLTTLAKILAGGLPGGCVGGRAEILALLEKANPHGQKMPHPGTFNANPLSAAAGIATLELVRDGRACRKANDTARRLRLELNELFARERLPWIAYGRFSDFYIYPNYQGPRPGEDVHWPKGVAWQELASGAPTELRYAFRMAMLLHGVDLPGLRGMANAAHTDDDIRWTVEAVRASIHRLRAEGFLPS
jgi:glutamate-1-semialdehyde 2,1-aminomutase